MFVSPPDAKKKLLSTPFGGSEICPRPGDWGWGRIPRGRLSRKPPQSSPFLVPSNLLFPSVLPKHLKQRFLGESLPPPIAPRGEGVHRTLFLEVDFGVLKLFVLSRKIRTDSRGKTLPEGNHSASPPPRRGSGRPPPTPPIHFFI